MYTPLVSFIEQIDFTIIEDDRKELLDEVAAYLAPKFQLSERVNIICICTHNSRRSHLCQVWSKFAAMHYRLRKFNSYSGGTEATAVNQQIVTTLVNQGFKLITLSAQENSVYALKYADDLPPLHLFSKKYDGAYNPNQDFIAFMNCDHADENCPTVPGATARFKVNYQDPKRSDGSPDQETVYCETSELIAREMFYLFSKFK